MTDTLYIEKEIASNDLVQKIKASFPHAQNILCDRYTEVFNLKNQNFRLQKQNPAFILAHKHKGRILPVPETYTLGKKHNFYFSHILNCLYDCRYCFLQGMYRSAHYVLFVNYEDFKQDLLKTFDDCPDGGTFFSGYDGDSLAFNQVTQFVESFVPFFEKFPQHELELRTKSSHIRPLLNLTPTSNVIVAYSLNPPWVVNRFEHRTARYHQRLKALKTLQKQGWKVAIRFDPLIYHPNWKENYSLLFDQVFTELDTTQLHSITLGTFRMPSSIYKNMRELYPQEPLFYHQIENKTSHTGYSQAIEQELLTFCQKKILQYVSEEKFFSQNPQEAL